MAFHIRRVDYFYTRVKDQPGEAYKVLSKLADLGVNLLAFIGVPMGPEVTQLTLFPEDSSKLTEATEMTGMALDGPHRALLIQGDDQLGVLASLHEKLYQIDVSVYASYCVADGRGSFGNVIYIRPDEYDRAVAALGV